MARELRPPSRALALREGLTAFEPARLFLHGPRLALQPRGKGDPVVVLPGFGAGDLSTVPLRGYLRSLGHDVHGWGLGQNDGDVQRFVELLTVRVQRLAERHDRKVSLVGWSLGGVVAREVARDHPELVRQVITFGTPVIGGPRYTRAGAAYLQQGFDIDAVEAIIAERERTPITVPITAIYTKGDGVVAWRACLDHLNPQVEHIEVDTTHLGLGIHHRVFIELARRL
jgi:pimeloyl-ACP methyl ester carboxylesterase